MSKHTSSSCAKKTHDQFKFIMTNDMNILNKVLVNGLVGFTIVAGAGSVIAKGRKAVSVNTDGVVLDYNEQTHLAFMREEEKLARDV